MYYSVSGSMKGHFERVLLPAWIILLGLLLVGAYGKGVGGTAVSEPALLFAGGGNGVPFSFVPNVGQSDNTAHYLLQQWGVEAAFEERGVDISWVEAAGDSFITKMVGFEFLGADVTAVQGEMALPGMVNYLKGNDRAAWHTNVPTFGSVRYENLYPGITLDFRGNGGQLLATFELERGVELGRIGWRFEGAKAEIDPAIGGLDLIVDGELSPIQLAAPQGWQIIDGEAVPFSLNYRVGADDQIGLRSTERLAVEPVFVALPMSLPGGGGLDVSKDIAVDNAGNVYVIGDTTSANFPTVNSIQPHAGSWDTFVSKFSADGSTLLYSTFIGGGDNEWAGAIEVDEYGIVYLTGETHSSDYPIVNPMQATLNGTVDAFVGMLSADGSSLLYSTYFGGSGVDSGTDIYPKNNDIFLIGETVSSDFPTQNALQPLHGGLVDAFFTKMTPGSNILVFSSYLGGDFDDYAKGLAIDGSDNVVVVGQTNSDNFPTASPIQGVNQGNWDLFLTAVAADGGSYLYSTFLGGTNSDSGGEVAIDGAGNVHLTGSSNSNDFPLVDPFPVGNPAGPDIVVATVSADGSTLLFSGLLGASDVERGFDIALDSDGNKYLTGFTASTNFPLQNSIQSNLNGAADIFVTKLDVNNEVVFSSYLGGERNELGQAVAVDGAQNIYVTGDTMSFDFPVANAYQPGYRGGTGDVVVVKINGLDYGLDYSTYLGGGPYPGNPTAVSVSGFYGRSGQFNVLFYLGAALLLVLLAGSVLVRNRRVGEP